MNEQEAWERRHVALFRTHRGHDACSVPGCIGGQPLHWVPTAQEVAIEPAPRWLAMDFPTQPIRWPR